MIVAGFGFRKNATTQSLREALGMAARTVTPNYLATTTDKVASLRPLAEELGVTVVAIPQGALIAQETQTLSAQSLSERGTGSVAEAAALAAIGEGARLIAPRAISDDRLATCALAACANEDLT